MLGDRQLDIFDAHHGLIVRTKNVRQNFVLSFKKSKSYRPVCIKTYDEKLFMNNKMHFRVHFNHKFKVLLLCC